MKKILLFLFGFLVFCSCKKNNNPATIQEMVTGALRYSDPASDGQGLYYVTDDAETLIIKDDSANLTSQDPKYSDFVNIHSRLTFTYCGEKGCLWSMVTGPCSSPIRKVTVVKLEKL